MFRSTQDHHKQQEQYNYETVTAFCQKSPKWRFHIAPNRDWEWDRDQEQWVTIMQNCSHCTGTGTGNRIRKICNGFPTHFSGHENISL